MLAAPSHAQSFSKLLDRALNSDPTFMGARTGVDLAEARKRQAFGSLLPQVSATANTTGNDRKYHQHSDYATTERETYNSNAAQVTLTQPLWRYANIVSWQQAKTVVAQAEFQFAGAEQDLFVRLGTAWFDVLAARDNVLFTGQQVEAAQRFWETVKRGEELGTQGMPQVEEARMKLDQAIADTQTAETELQLKYAAVEQIVGQLNGFSPPYMRDYAVLADLGPEKLEVWLARVEDQNPNILSATKALEAASDEVRKQSAGHQPTLELVVNYGKNSQQVGSSPGQAGYDTLQGSIGLQLNVPIFSGGTQSAKTDEALAQKERARLELEAARRSAILATKQAWFNWQSARSREKAGAQGIRLARSSMQVARVGIEKGLKTELDLLQAEQQWRAAIRDFRKGRYDQAASLLKLKAASGVLTNSDLHALDVLFVSTEEEAQDPSLGRAVGEKPLHRQTRDDVEEGESSSVKDLLGLESKFNNELSAVDFPGDADAANRREDRVIDARLALRIDPRFGRSARVISVDRIERALEAGEGLYLRPFASIADNLADEVGRRPFMLEMRSVVANGF